MPVSGWPIDDVEELDARLSENFGGAQLWQLARDDDTTTAVGVTR
jgi:hypothetical protein